MTIFSFTLKECQSFGVYFFMLVWKKLPFCGISLFYVTNVHRIWKWNIELRCFRSQFFFLYSSIKSKHEKYFMSTFTWNIKRVVSIDVIRARSFVNLLRKISTIFRELKKHLKANPNKFVDFKTNAFIFHEFVGFPIYISNFMCSFSHFSSILNAICWYCRRRRL